MNQKELTETFMMISNWKKNHSFGGDVFYKLIQRFETSFLTLQIDGSSVINTRSEHNIHPEVGIAGTTHPSGWIKMTVKLMCIKKVKRVKRIKTTAKLMYVGKDVERSA